jgi:hypothetical protein
METAKEKFTDVTFDYLVYPRLNVAGIVLFKQADNISCIEEVTVDAENELLKRHRFTAITFIKYCIDTMTEIFANEKNPPEIPEYLYIIQSILGYHHAVSSLLKSEYRGSYPEFSVIKTLFSKEEFGQIAELIRETLIKFPDQCKKSMKWMIEHPSHEKKQVNTLEVFAKALLQYNAKNQTELQTLANNVVNEVSLSPPRDHSLLRIKKREELGLLTPGKELIITIRRVMDMLDIMHYGGYVNINDQFLDPELVKFEKWH